MAKGVPGAWPHGNQPGRSSSAAAEVWWPPNYLNQQNRKKKLKYRQVLKQQYVLEVPNFPFIVLNSLRKITYRYLLRQLRKI